MIELQPDRELTRTDAEKVLAEWLGWTVTCVGIERLTGGEVNSVFRLRFDTAPGTAVIKVHSPENARFAAEADGLRLLAAQTGLPVPDVYAVDPTTTLIPHAFLLLEDVPGRCVHELELDAEARAALDGDIAAALAELHGHVGVGFGEIGHTGERPWAEEFADRLHEARRHPEIDRRLASDTLADIDRIIGAAPAVLADSGNPALVHGDVWDGNLIARQVDGVWRLAAFVDPAPRYADAESEIAYLEVFDVDRAALLAAYTRRRPLRPGYERRRRFFWLHTALVHVALFEEPFFGSYTERLVADIVADLEG